MGFSVITGDPFGTVMHSDNASFDGTKRGGVLSANGDLWIGSGVSPRVKKGTITSTTLTIGYSSPNITINTMGGGVPIEQVTVDGGQVITPTGTPENITLVGQTVANLTHGKSVFINKTGVSSATVDIQVAAAIAATSIVRTGLAAFNSTQFTVDANGFVSTSGTGVGNTITGDSGGALSPTAGNWNILGRSGSKTSGATSTLTIKSPPYADAGGSGTSTLNSGSFVTGAFTLTLPASAGLADGDLFEYVATSASAIVIQAVSAQKIRIGTLLSSAAGTATSTAIGDSVSLRFRATDGFFYATSVIGTWLIA